MPAAGSLRLPELFHHDPARDVPTTDAPHAGPVLDHTQYHDLWCYLGTRDPRITRAYPALMSSASLEQTCCPKLTHSVITADSSSHRTRGPCSVTTAVWPSAWA
ncbi:MAG: hypothetical protein ACRDQX_13310 [Pseudonocardiaceae bacterium]